MTAVHEIGHHPPEHGVAQKFEPFVGFVAVVFGNPGPVAKRRSQELLVAEPMTDPLGQFVQ